MTPCVLVAVFQRTFYYQLEKLTSEIKRSLLHSAVITCNYVSVFVTFC
jgi:hypothetical protein